MGNFAKKAIGWISGVFKKWALPFFAGILFALLCFVAINAAMKPVSTSEYCGTKCHEMDTAYQSWKLGIHGDNSRGLRIGCVDCHAPSKDDYFTHLAFKAYAGGKDLYKHYFGGEYDSEKMLEKVREHFSNERCLNCHVDLLGENASEDIKGIHMEALTPADSSEQTKCIDCHEDTGHSR